MKSRELLRVLVTVAGAPGTRGTVHALRNNPDGVTVHISAVDMRAEAVGRYFVDSFSTVPPPEHGSYIGTLLDIALEENTQLIIPQTTREMEVLSRHKATFEDKGIAVMVSDATSIGKANDKVRLLDEFRRVRLSTPEYRLASSEAELLQAVEALGYPDRPVVVKPPRSNGMRGVRILRENSWDVMRFLSEKPSGLEVSLDELVAILRRGEMWPALVVMEYLPG